MIDYDRIEKFLDGNPDVAPKTVTISLMVLADISLFTGGVLPHPYVSVTKDGETYFYWDTGRYYLDLEVHPSGVAGLFCRDRQTETYWGEEYEVGSPSSAEIAGRVVSIWREQ